MTVAAPLASHRRARSRHAETLRDAVAELAVGHDVIQRGPMLDGVVNGTTLGSVSLVFVRYGGSVVVEAPATGDRIAVTVPLGPMVVRRHDERTLVGESFVLADDRPTVMRPDPFAGAIVIAVDRAQLDQGVTRLTGLRHAPVEFGHRWASPVVSSAVIDASWRHAATVLAATPSTPPVAVAALESMLVDALLLGAPHSHSATLLAPRGAGTGHAERAKAWLEAHLAQLVTVTDLAAAVGLSVRQLQQVVRDRYGVSPMTLLRELRLERARLLLTSGTVTSVSRAAAASGFTHHGRFAAAYRERYGELPSSTL